MKNIKYLVLAVLCGMFAFSACSNDEEEIPERKLCKIAEKDVPERVLKAFQDDYGNIDGVLWKKMDGYFVVHFNSSMSRTQDIAEDDEDYDTSIWYSYEGLLCQKIIKVAYPQLPLLVRNVYKEYKEKYYPVWRYLGSALVSRSGMGAVYVSEISVDGIKRKIFFSVNGDLLKDVLDTDNEILYPFDVPAGIKTALQELYPDHEVVILELEFDGNTIKVDIWEDERHKEVELDTGYNWSRTVYNITLIDALDILEPKVMNELAELALSYNIDIFDAAIQTESQVEMVEDAVKGVFFDIKIEYEETEFEVKIDKYGNRIV